MAGRQGAERVVIRLNDEPCRWPRRVVVADDSRGRDCWQAVARCSLPGLPDQPRNRHSYHRPSPAGIGRQSRARLALLVLPRLGTDAGDPRSAQAATGRNYETGCVLTHVRPIHHRDLVIDEGSKRQSRPSRRPCRYPSSVLNSASASPSTGPGPPVPPDIPKDRGHPCSPIVAFK
jgi:hypothetical protein